MIVTIPVRTVSTLNAREHWRTMSARAKKHREGTYWALRASKQAEPTSGTVRLTRVAPRVLDGDNLQASLKNCRDGVADWLGIDDGDARIKWEYAQRRGAPRSYSVEVEVLAEGVGCA